MKLCQITESELGIPDSTNQLVAVRKRFNFATNMWTVYLDGQPLGMLAKMDTKWKHDNWDWTYFTRYDQNLEPGFVQIMTKNNRAYLDKCMQLLSREVKQAISEKRADIVTMPVDPSQIEA